MNKPLGAVNVSVPSPKEKGQKNASAPMVSIRNLRLLFSVMRKDEDSQRWIETDLGIGGELWRRR